MFAFDWNMNSGRRCVADVGRKTLRLGIDFLL